MTNTREIILKLKEVKQGKELSYSQILALMEKNGDYLSKSTLSRLFADGSENESFKYDETIRPVAKALLDIETIEDDDTMDVQAMKVLLRYKIKRIEEQDVQIEQLKAALDREKVKSNEKIEKERERFNKSIDFLKEQIALKDKRMDMLLEHYFVKEK